MAKMSKKQTDLATELRAAFEGSDMNRLGLSQRSGGSHSVIHRFLGDERSFTRRAASEAGGGKDGG